MKYLLTLGVLLTVGCSKPVATTYDLSVASDATGDPDHKEAEVRFEVPDEAEIQVAVGDDKSTLIVDSLNSNGTFLVSLSATRDEPLGNREQSFTTQVILKGPSGQSVGGPSTYTLDDKTSLESFLDVTAVDSTVPLGKPHTIGTLNGQPITLVVNPIAVAK